MLSFLTRVSLTQSRMDPPTVQRQLLLHRGSARNIEGWNFGLDQTALRVSPGESCNSQPSGKTFYTEKSGFRIKQLITLNTAACGEPSSMKGGLPVAISTIVHPNDQISAWELEKKIISSANALNCLFETHWSPISSLSLVNDLRRHVLQSSGKSFCTRA